MSGSHFGAPGSQNLRGADSVTAPAVAGKKYLVTRVAGWFGGPGPQAGTLRLKFGSTVVWEATVSGALDASIAMHSKTSAAGQSVTLELSGGNVWLVTLLEYD